MRKQWLQRLKKSKDQLLSPNEEILSLCVVILHSAVNQLGLGPFTLVKAANTEMWMKTRTQREAIENIVRRPAAQAMTPSVRNSWTWALTQRSLTMI